MLLSGTICRPILAFQRPIELAVCGRDRLMIRTEYESRHVNTFDALKRVRLRGSTPRPWLVVKRATPLINHRVIRSSLAKPALR